MFLVGILKVAGYFNASRAQQITASRCLSDVNEVNTCMTNYPLVLIKLYNCGQ